MLGNLRFRRKLQEVLSGKKEEAFIINPRYLLEAAKGFGVKAFIHPFEKLSHVTIWFLEHHISYNITRE